MNLITRSLATLLLLNVMVLRLFSQDTTHIDAFFSGLQARLVERQTPATSENIAKQIEVLRYAVRSGRLDQNELKRLQSAIARMENLRLRPYPHLAALLATSAATLHETAWVTGFDAWLAQLEKLLIGRDPRQAERLLEHSAHFITQQRIAGRGTTQWFMRKGSAVFTFDTTLSLNISRANLVCSTLRDSLTIYETSGVLRVMTQQWYGKGGKAGWERFGLPLDEAWVELSDYTIDMNRPVIKASPVIARFPGKLDKPLQGVFEDQVYNTPPNDRTPHPRFKSLLSRVELVDIYPGVDFSGSVLMQGNSLVADSGDEGPARLIIRRGGKVVARASAARFDLSMQKTQARRTALSIYFDGDSLYHPGLDFRFDNTKRQIMAVRNNEGWGRAPFSSSYHKLFLLSEAMYWNIDDDLVHFRSLDGMNTQSRVRVTSHNYFSEQDFRRLQMIDETHPMYQIEQYIKETSAGTTIPLNFLATFMRKPPEQVVALVLNLVEKGYLLYDGDSNSITVLQAFGSTLAASAGKEDFDVLRLDSEVPARKSNVMLKISDFSLTVAGVGEVVLSKKQGVQLMPDSNQVVFGKNRDFRFKGHVKAGLFDFYAREAVFEYEPFQLQFSFIDSLAFAVLKKDQQPTGRKPQYVKVRNVIADLAGTLRIDEPRNKSGRNELAEYPSFTSTGESYVYFDNPSIQQGALKRESFYYVVDPFTIDSLSNFSTENFRITGYLNSGNMFPVIREQLNVMPDYALGFEHKLPKEGYPVFGGLARYFTELSLSADGFLGLGQLDYQTSTIFSKQFRFYPDSVSAITDQWLMHESFSPVSFPAGKGNVLKLRWNVPENILYLQTIQEAAQLYASTSMLGTIELSPNGSKGHGRLSFEQASVASERFSFLTRSLTADTADFSLMPLQGTKPAFLATHYKVMIDFDKRTGNFSHIGPKSRLSFPYNQYGCTLDEALWQMDQTLILLNNRRMADRFNLSKLNEYELIRLDLSGSGFTSEHPDQGGLSFFTLEAAYDINRYAIEAKQVKILRVADAAIFPTDGNITVLQDARMLPLESALIIADTSNKFHRIENARVNIISKSQYKASGNYTYRDISGEVSVVRFTDIAPNASGVTTARGKVDMDNPLKLNPWFAFSGEVLLSADLRTLRFNGGYRLNHTCFETTSTWVQFDTLVDPTNVMLPLRPVMNDQAGNRVYTGLFYSAANDRYRAYLLQNSGGVESMVSAVSGLIFYDKGTMSYKVESKQGDTKDYLVLSTGRCIIKGQGTIDLNLRLPNIKLETYGGYQYKLIPDSLYLDVSMTLKFPVDDKLIALIGDSLAAANLPAANLNQGNYLFSASKLLSLTETERLKNEIILYGSPRRLPEALVNTFYFSDIRLKWNAELRSFVSMGTLMLASVNRTMVNKSLDGFIELEQSRVSDGFSIYLMPTARQWYFITYRSGLMQLLSSSDVFNNALAAIKDEKRMFTDQQGNKFEYTLANRRRMVDFLRKIQNLEF